MAKGDQLRINCCENCTFIHPFSKYLSRICYVYHTVPLPMCESLDKLFSQTIGQTFVDLSSHAVREPSDTWLLKVWSVDQQCWHCPGSLLEMLNIGPHPRTAAPVSAFQ